MSQMPTLKSASKVAVLATAKRLESSYELGVSKLQDWGFEPVIYDSVHTTDGYFAGSDDLRISDFQKAINDPEIEAILFLRGGYGSTRIIDKIDFTALIENPKWLIGFSDITSILLSSDELGIPSIHGPVAITLGKDAASDSSLYALLTGSNHCVFPIEKSSFTKRGQTQARIIGGNLCMICESIGTPNEIQTEGKILFLEEVGEEFYAVDRMMNKLKRAGKLDGLKGLILGSFTSISDRQSYFSTSIEKLITQYFEHLDIPIAVGFSAGHEQPNYPLIFGWDAKLDIGLDSLKIQYLK